MLNICISGAAGRMGAALIEASREKDWIRISGLLEKEGSPEIGRIVSGVEIVSDVKKAVDGCDCFIEFTTPSATLSHISEIDVPAVVGTTGFTFEGTKKLGKLSEKIPIVFSPNMSLGVNLLFSLVKTAGRKLSGYDIEIVEAHHNRKKDAPSGTARRIAEILKELGDYELVHGRNGNIGARKKNEIGIHAVRAGDIVGEHTVIFAGAGECFELSHRAYSRSCFAEGALLAAKWVASARQPGLYTMADVLEIE
ncbi:MAG: 4-hydroxy-tetrahydrodipicolinate reductase [Elusimicrobia bacterium]|nr:4-hydroxy-tetrahydrodipicolinate reductase [Elusimicrobiota bacterium]